MRQYELAIRVAQIHHLTDERKYKKALAVIRTLDMRQIKSLSDLSAIAEVYTKTEQFDAAKATYLRIYRKSRTRRILYKLIYLAIRTNELEEAEGYYQEFVSMAPSERDTLILRYRIDKASGVPIGQLIEILESLKEEEYIEEWAYELAKLYYKAGKMEECRNECEDIKLWFGSGEIVERAKKLIETVDDSNKMPFIDDKDFTIKEKEEANPDDTGSLPALNEYLQSKRERDRQKAKQQYEEENEEYEEGIYEIFNGYSTQLEENSFLYPLVDAEATGKRIHELMIERGFEPHDIQKVMGGLSHTSVYNWFNGKSLPRIDFFVVLSNLFNVPLDELIVVQHQKRDKVN